MALNKIDIRGITFLMTGNRERFVYKDGERTDERQGISIQCVAKEAGYEAISFNLPDIDALLIPEGEEVPPDTVVEFADPVVTVYTRRTGGHALRHSHVALLISLGENALAIRDRLGHEDVQTTLGTYGHLYPQANRAVADRLDAAFEGDAHA